MGTPYQEGGKKQKGAGGDEHVATGTSDRL
jgi:hypothetical protein